MVGIFFSFFAPSCLVYKFECYNILKSFVSFHACRTIFPITFLCDGCFFLCVVSLFLALSPNEQNTCYNFDLWFFFLSSFQFGRDFRLLNIIHINAYTHLHDCHATSILMLPLQLDQSGFCLLNTLKTQSYQQYVEKRFIIENKSLFRLTSVRDFILSISVYILNSHS